MAQRRLEVVITGDPRRAKQAMSEVEGRASRMRGKLTAIGRGAALAIGTAGIAAAGGVALGLKSAYDAAIEARQISRETERVIRTTGGAAKVSAADVGLLAENVSKLTGVDDEYIQQGSNLLLTFTNIRNEVGKGNDVFNRATTLALDMSKVMKTDLKSSAVQVGKALNDPTKGITALSRAGVSFTAEQKNMIKWLQASGDTLGAQKIILAELTKEFGGAAAAAATPTDRLRVMIGNLQESIGEKLIPVVEKGVAWLSNAGTQVGNLVRMFRSGEADSQGFAEILDNIFGNSGRLIPIFRRIYEVTATLVNWWKQNWPAIKIAIADLVNWVQAEALPRIRQFIDGAQEKFQQVVDWVRQHWPAIQETIIHIVNVVQAYWERFGTRIVANARYIWNTLYQIIKIGVNLIAGIIRIVTAVINGDWGKAWNAIKETFSRVFGGVVAIARNLVGMLANVFAGGREILMSIIGGLTSWIVDKFGGVAGGIARAFAGVAGIITAPFRAAINGIRSFWNSTLGGKGFKAPSWVPGIGGKGFEIPRLHTGGIYRAPTPGGQGLALLRDRERVFTPGSGGGVTVIVQGSVLTERDLADTILKLQRKGLLPRVA